MKLTPKLEVKDLWHEEKGCKLYMNEKGEITKVFTEEEMKPFKVSFIEKLTIKIKNKLRKMRK